MNVKGWIAGLLFVPALVAGVEALSFHVRERNNGSIVSGGERREYLLYVPQSYDASKPVPLMISMHGAGGWPKQQMDLSQWNEVADRDGFIVAYPAGSEGPGPRVWHVGDGAASVKDVRFIADLIEKIGAAYNIDRHRIYANGFSNGGGMSFALSCAMPDRIAAFGLVGAALPSTIAWCTDRRPAPMIAFHGTDDPDAAYGGGETWMSPFPFASVERFAMTWAQRNRCASQPVESKAAPDVARREYTHCADGASVILYTIHGGGHTWPGGGELPAYFVGPNTHSINATREMWSFFQAHQSSAR